MVTLRSSFLRTLQARGYIHQCTDLERLDTVLAQQPPIAAYIGFDCTADSLHVGSLVQIMLLRRLQQSGHKPIVLMGGSTTRVGDPSGKDTMRQLLPETQIVANMASLQKVFANFLTFGTGPSDAILIDNTDWLSSLNHIAFLGDYGRHFSVNRMLGLDSIRSRLERGQPLTFLEFNYIVLQSYDFLELWRRAGCCLQMGGADQWGNIVNGIELARRVEGVELFGLTSPLITTMTGVKMGKTLGGAVWLNADRLSPYGYWQFWRNTEDSNVGRFLRLFTDLPLDVIDRLESLSGTACNKAKWRLAYEATRLAHGEKAASTAAETARKVFEEGTLGQAMPVLNVPAAALAEEGLSLLDAMRQAGLVRSNGEARRLVRSGGARVNNLVIGDETHRLTATDLKDGAIKLSAGRKHHVLVRTAVIQNQGRAC
ncbi:Tyrosyl-tRNA synthetase [invertebrate metagenome]|uniref:tyrosine--tRNA ligase n=1 Tax=invertebrate metagenome TaxID=1711999 RepID=A0A484H536_9ZZZZ